MSIIRRMTIVLAAMLVLLAGVVGVGIGVVAGRGGIDRGTVLMVIVMTVVALVALALCIAAAVLLRGTLRQPPRSEKSGRRPRSPGRRPLRCQSSR